MQSHVSYSHFQFNLFTFNHQPIGDASSIENNSIKSKIIQGMRKCRQCPDISMARKLKCKGGNEMVKEQNIETVNNNKSNKIEKSEKIKIRFS